MKFDLKRFLIPLISGILGIVIIVISVLGFTVLRPADTVTAIGQTSAQGNAVYTKAGVLNIYADPVTISVQSKDNAELVMVTGKSYDISAYAAILKATEIKGLKTWEKLELSDVSQASQDVTPEPASIETSDLWDKTITGKGKVSQTIPGQTQGLSVLVFAKDGDQAFTVSLDWQHKRVQYWPWALLVLGVLILLGAGVYAWILSRKPVAQDKEEHLEEDAEQAETVDAVETAEETSADEEVISEPIVLNKSEEDLLEEDIPVESEEESSESSESGEDLPDEDIPVESEEESSESSESGENSESEQDDVDNELDGNSDSDDNQPSLESGEREITSESGRIISIHTATGEIRLPSRGALRSARERGQKSMELDGVSYATGAIPLVDLASEDDAPVDQIEVSEVLPDEVENMIQDAANAGKATGVRPGESLWERLHRYRSTKFRGNRAGAENNNEEEDNSRNE